MGIGKRISVALTIAGSDSGGGAGIQADLKTFAALGVHGTSAVTAVTAQNTRIVDAVQEIEPRVVERQIEAVARDFAVDAAKTGMLGSAPIVSAVAKSVKRHSFPLVVDPVMVSKSGAKLLADNATETLIKTLLPAAAVVTPNVPEAERLVGNSISGITAARAAAKKIVEDYGARACVVKGGHLTGPNSVDILYYRGETVELKATRIPTKNTHGTGCTFSAAIAADLAKGADIPSAVRTAKTFVTNAITYSIAIGRGNGPVNPSSWSTVDAEKYRVIENLRRAVEVLETHAEVAGLIPEVQTNLVMALPRLYARSAMDVAGIRGRIVRIGGRVRASSHPSFGASSHVARAILKAMEYDDGVRAAADVKYNAGILQAAKNLGFTTSLHDRSREPPAVRKTEGASIPWGVEQAIKRVGAVPDIIFDLGGWGKEPLMRVFGRDAIEVADRIVRIAEGYKKTPGANKGGEGGPPKEAR